jgi:hypothetical protein
VVVVALLLAVVEIEVCHKDTEEEEETEFMKIITNKKNKR